MALPERMPVSMARTRSAQRLRWSCTVLCLLACLLAACSADATRGRRGLPSGGDAGATAGTSGASGAAGTSTSGAGADAAGSAGSQADAGDPDDCASVSQAAVTFSGKADVIWLLDNSASMFEEIATVQAGFAAFVDSIEASGADLHTVLVTDASVCMPAPVGNGACPNDSNPSRAYLHYPVMLADFDLFSKFRDTLPAWRDQLRSDSAKMIIAVSDGDALTPDEAMSMTPLQIAQGMRDWIAMQPEFAQGPSAPPWKFSAIYCTKETLTCGDANVLPALVDLTGGIHGALDAGAAFDAVIQEIAKLVVKESKPVDCEWGIPPAPAGQTFDPMKVNLEYTTGGGAAIKILNVPSAAKCHATQGGWYYDDAQAPTRVVACPVSCSELQADEHARIDVKFGCKTEVLVQ